MAVISRKYDKMIMIFLLPHIKKYFLRWISKPIA